MEEDVAKIANEKNEQGVRTPKHLAIKRVMEGEKTICWVLQERAKGKNFRYYCHFDNNPIISIDRQKELLSAPDSHFDNLINDLCALINVGIEVKAKNLFYDNDNQSGGFTIIDLLGGSNKPFNSDSIEDILKVWNNASDIISQTTVSQFSDDQESYRKSIELSMQLRQRAFASMERVIPGFYKYRRNILRTFNPEMLRYFEEHGTEVGDLTLTKEEKEEFKKRNNEIIEEVIQKIKKDEYKINRYVLGLGAIQAKLRDRGLIKAWLYHSGNKSKDSQQDSEKNLFDLMQKLFDNRLCELAETTDEQWIKETINQMQERRKRLTKTTHVRTDEIAEYSIEFFTPTRLADDEEARKASEKFDSEVRDKKSSKDNSFHII